MPLWFTSSLRQVFYLCWVTGSNAGSQKTKSNWIFLIFVQAHGSKSTSGTGSSACGPRNRNFCQLQGAAGSEDAVKTSKPASPSPVKPEPDLALANSTNTNDWSPLDDKIVVVVPHASPNNNNSPSREDVNAYISSILYGPSTKIRLPAFAELCSQKLSPWLKGPLAVRK